MNESHDPSQPPQITDDDSMTDSVSDLPPGQGHERANDLLLMQCVLAHRSLLGARARARKLERRREELDAYAQTLRQRGVPTSIVPKMLEASQRHIAEGPISLGDLLEELQRYIEERVQAGEDRLAVLAEMHQAGRTQGLA